MGSNGGSNGDGNEQQRGAATAASMGAAARGSDGVSKALGQQGEATAAAMGAVRVSNGGSDRKRWMQ